MRTIVGLLVSTAQAEERDDLGPNQFLRADTTIQVEIVDAAVDRIFWSAELVDPSNGAVREVSMDLLDPNGGVTTVLSGQVVIPPVVGRYAVDPEDLDLDGDGITEPLSAWEISVQVGGATVDGRVWSKRWRIDAAGVAEPFAANGSLFAVVEGGSAGASGVVELKADGLSGTQYSIIANQDGIVDGQGRSQDDSSLWNAIGEHPIYLRQPDPDVVSYLWDTPAISLASIVPEGTCGAVAPGVAGAGALVSFDSNIDGILHLVCDLDGDGVFDLTSDDDFHLLEDVSPGVNELLWDGLDNVGTAAPPGTYDCVMKLTVGEFHFVATDIESSYEGFRLFEVAQNGVRTGLPMFWNDAEVQYRDVLMDNGEEGLASSGADGLASGQYGDQALPNVNARSWGNFSVNSKGDDALLDTYTWLAEDQTRPNAIEIRDATNDADDDGLVDAAEECVHGTRTDDPDSDGDGAGDFAEATVGPSSPLDPDSDDDGLLDGEELPDPLNPTDTDSDGLADPVDPDDDDDGVPTLTEGGDDTDDDGILDAYDRDDDGDRVETADEDRDGDGDALNDDIDGDSIPDFLDEDDDNDGLFPEDPDGDDNPLNDDTDGDLLIDTLDDDDDGDGILTADDFDPLDDDDDGDGIPTSEEYTVRPNGDHVPDGDTDDDGTPDYLDLDSDDDTVLDGVRAPGDTVAWDASVDTDGDGDRDFQDTDDDNDEILTINEDTDGSGNWQDDDDDGDARPDYLDASNDEDNDTILDGVEATRGDSDGDGRPDFQDADDDGDGIDTIFEIGDDFDDDGIDDNLDPDDDDDGIRTLLEGDRDTDTDDDGVPNYLDDDSDADGLLDAEEGSGDPDGDGDGNFADLDSDGDGFVDALEQRQDSDGDDVFDFVDADDDGDGVLSPYEGRGDTDVDGIDDRLDLDDDGDGISTRLEFDDGRVFGNDPEQDGVWSWVDLDADGDEADDHDEGRGDEDEDGVPNYLDADGAIQGWYRGSGLSVACDATGAPPVSGWLVLVIGVLGWRRRSR